MPFSSLDLGGRGSRRAATACRRNRRRRGGIVMDHKPARVSTVVPTCAFPMISHPASHLELHRCNFSWDLIRKRSAASGSLDMLRAGGRCQRSCGGDLLPPGSVSSLSATGLTTPRDTSRTRATPLRRPAVWQCGGRSREGPCVRIDSFTRQRSQVLGSSGTGNLQGLISAAADGHQPTDGDGLQWQRAGCQPRPLPV
jgi:hypothetical protein